MVIPYHTSTKSFSRETASSDFHLPSIPGWPCLHPSTLPVIRKTTTLPGCIFTFHAIGISCKCLDLLSRLTNKIVLVSVPDIYIKFPDYGMYQLPNIVIKFFYDMLQLHNIVLELNTCCMVCNNILHSYFKLHVNYMCLHYIYIWIIN